MDKQKKNDMFCCQTSNTISDSQKCSQCSQNRGSKKSIRPYFPSKTGSLPLILRLRDRYHLCFFQLLLHLFQLLDCWQQKWEISLPRKMKEETKIYICYLPPQTLHIIFASSSPKILPSSPGYIFSTRASISPPRPLSPLDRSAATQLLEGDRCWGMAIVQILQLYGIGNNDCDWKSMMEKTWSEKNEIWDK